MKNPTLKMITLAFLLTAFFYLVLMIGSAQFNPFDWSVYVRWAFSILILFSGLFSWSMHNPRF